MSYVIESYNQENNCIGYWRITCLNYVLQYGSPYKAHEAMMSHCKSFNVNPNLFRICEIVPIKVQQETKELTERLITV